MTTTHVYAIASITPDNRHVYWNKSTKTWGNFNSCTFYDWEQRKKTKLPAGGQWVSVLHGIGQDAHYPTPIGWDFVVA